MKALYVLVIAVIVLSCSNENASPEAKVNSEKHAEEISNTSLVLLGTIQDAGFPQIACKKECCKNVYEHPELKRLVASLGLIDVPNHKTYLFDATPDISLQMKRLTEFEGKSQNEFVDGIFLTHAHIGHYTGLMYLGKEATDAKNIPVFSMPRMKEFLTNNGPWSQLVSRGNIRLEEIQDQISVKLSDEIEVTPFLVPHRDEFSETVGYLIKGPNKTAMFIPDIDKWKKWDQNIVEEIKKVDYAFLDATFYIGKEINNRDISQIPHPFIIESFETFKELDKDERNKIIFIHFNHTNPVIDIDSDEAKEVIKNGFRVGRPNEVFEL